MLFSSVYNSGFNISVFSIDPFSGSEFSTETLFLHISCVETYLFFYIPSLDVIPCNLVE
jgi:hypothetical protein